MDRRFKYLNNTPFNQLKYFIATLTIGLYYAYSSHTTRTITNQEIEKLNSEIIDLQMKRERLKDTEIKLNATKGKVPFTTIKEVVEQKSKAEEENLITDKEYVGALLY